MAVRPQPKRRAEPPSPASVPARRASLAAPLVLALLGVVAYANTLAVPFIFDDEVAVVGNPTIRDLSWSALWPPARRVLAGRPLVNLSFALNYAVGGLDPTGYHLVNLGLHVAAGLVLLGILRRTLPRAGLPPALVRASSTLAFVSAAVWLVHPLVTEAVTYVTQRTELLMGLCYLLTVYAAIRAWDAPDPRWWTVASVVACACGMLSKEVMASAPVMVALYDRVFLARSFADAWRRRRGLYLGLAATWFPFLVILALHERSDVIGFGGPIGSWEYARTQPGVLLHYLRLTFWPSGLNVDPGMRTAKTVGEIVPPALVIAVLLGATVWALVRMRPLGFVGAWCFLILAPTSSVMPIVTEIVAERRMYLPLAALVASVVVGVAVAGERLAGRQAPGAGYRLALAGKAIAAVLVVVLTSLTAQRNRVYVTELSILTDALRLAPDNYRAHNNVASLLLDAGRHDEAIAHLREAIRLEPRYANAYYNLGTAFLDQERWEEAIAEYERALRLDPRRVEAHANLGTALFSLGRIDEAARHYAEAARLDPGSAIAHNNLGMALLNQGRVDAAIAEFSEAIRLDPTLPQAHENLRDARAVPRE